MLSLQQFFELPKVRSHDLSDTGHGHALEQAARTAELELHRVRDPGSLWDGVQGIDQTGREGPELASNLQLAGRVIGGDLQAFFASAGNRADLVIGGPHAYRPFGDLVGLDDGVVPLGMFSRSERNANTSSMGLAIITVFSRLPRAAPV
jgi:hypothetical protein